VRKTPEQQEREKTRAERIEQAHDDDLRALLRSAAFRRWLKRYLVLANVFRTTFTGNSETFFKEGQRSMGTTMFGELMRAAPQCFQKLMAEKLPEDQPD